MNRNVLMTLLVGLLVLSLVAPFAALSMLMLVMLVTTIAWVGLTLFQSVASDEPEQRDS